MTPKQPDYIFYNDLGIALQAQGKTTDAIHAFHQALKLNPKSAQTHYNLGIAYHTQGVFKHAIDAYKNALEIDANFLNASSNLGVALRDYGLIDQAIHTFITTLSKHPDFADGYYNLGIALEAKGSMEHAQEAYKRALALNPTHVEALNNLGNILYTQDKYDEAIAHFTQAIALNPRYVGAYNNLGIALKTQGKSDEAIDAYQKAIELNPQYPDAYNNLGNALYDQGKCQEALRAFEKALSLNPNYADAKWNKSFALLLAGELKEGFAWYEYRWEVKNSLKDTKRTYDVPLWLGKEPLEGKRILVYAEQGLGDTLQFCRYLELLEQQGAHVIFEVQKPLLRLLQPLKGVHDIIELGAPLPSFDVHCPLLSLPHAFGTTLESIPSNVPYIGIAPEIAHAWEKKLGTKHAFRVGIVWNGGFRANQPELWHVNERRNIPFEQIAKLNRSDIAFYSLQKGEPAQSEFNEKAPLLWKDANLFDFMDDVDDFADTAGLISQLDLIISVDTSTAHLAAAMGKPVWLLNRFDTCWRWMQDTEASPWYPSLRIFRQSSWGDWEGVIQNVSDALEILLQKK